MAPAVLVIQAVRDEPIDAGVIAGGSVVLFLLAPARMGGLASEVAMQAERLRGELEDELAAGITGLRRLMAELRPAVLDEQGLEVALHNQVWAFEATSGVPAPSPPASRAGWPPIWRRSCTGSPRNRSTTWASTRRLPGDGVAGAENGSVRLRINDDGVGFDPAAAARLLSEGHFGLAGMRERVEMVGGHLSIDSAPGKGTSVAVEMANPHSSN